ncbi:hypothetical protein [Pontimicrobium sp. SW4]|uniref:Uncharacterized protein n=1 Tax=Pontimicrobium sp. SW4 TaxID=3153519 RepID=A0AAU7BVD3_9FLAO
MHRKIIIKAFEKARKEAQKKGINHPSNNFLAKILSDYISNEFKTPIGERRLRDYYKLAIHKGINDEGDINITQLNVVNALCEYLGYKNYQDFVVKNRLKIVYEDNSNEEDTLITISPENILKKNDRIDIRIRKNKIVLSISMLAIILLMTVVSMNNRRWMRWQEHQYVEVEFSINEFKKGNLKLYKEERFSLFKKIIPDCYTVFFDTDGNEKIWYGRNEQENMEFYTFLGLHPITNKILKPITPNIIKKHICATYSQS